MKGRLHKGIKRPTSKHAPSNVIKPNVTSTHGEPLRVTRGDSTKPSKRYERLEPWLRFANLASDSGELHSAYMQEFASRPIGTYPAVFFQLTISVRLALAQKRESKKLIETYKAVRDFLESVPAMEPRDGLNTSGADAEKDFPITFFASRAENGRLVFQADPLRSHFKDALDGVETQRIRRCPICEKIFFSQRITQRACSKLCNQTRRVREWRSKQAKYEYNRKLKSAGVKPQKKESL